MNRYLVVTVSSVLLLTLYMPAAAGPPSTVPRVGIMVAESPPSVFLEAFREGLREFGYVDGRQSRWRFAMPEADPIGMQRLRRSSSV